MWKSVDMQKFDKDMNIFWDSMSQDESNELHGKICEILVDGFSALAAFAAIHMIYSLL